MKSQLPARMPNRRPPSQGDPGPSSSSSLILANDATAHPAAPTKKSSFLRTLPPPPPNQHVLLALSNLHSRPRPPCPHRRSPPGGTALSPGGHGPQASPTPHTPPLHREDTGQTASLLKTGHWLPSTALEEDSQAPTKAFRGAQASLRAAPQMVPFLSPHWAPGTPQHGQAFVKCPVPSLMVSVRPREWRP